MVSPVSYPSNVCRVEKIPSSVWCLTRKEEHAQEQDTWPTHAAVWDQCEDSSYNEYTICVTVRRLPRTSRIHRRPKSLLYHLRLELQWTEPGMDVLRADLGPVEP